MVVVSTVRALRGALCLGIALIPFACDGGAAGSPGGAEGCEPGAEGCPCVDGEFCANGLDCLSLVCVDATAISSGGAATNTQTQVGTPSAGAPSSGGSTNTATAGGTTQGSGGSTNAGAAGPGTAGSTTTVTPVPSAGSSSGGASGEGGTSAGGTSTAGSGEGGSAGEAGGEGGGAGSAPTEISCASGNTGTRSFEGSLSAILTTGSAVVNFDSGSVSGLRHKRDVDVVEDGCVGGTGFTVRASNADGCDFTVVVLGELDFEYRFQVESVYFTADSQCPNFLDADEGNFAWGLASGATPTVLVGTVTMTPQQIPDMNVDESCLDATIGVHIETLTGQNLNVTGVDLTLEGSWPTESGVNCPQQCDIRCSFE